MPVRKAIAVWEGPFPRGNGKMRVESGSWVGAYSFGSRYGGEQGTNPEELLGAAHAGCFSMALSDELTRGGFAPRSIETVARVNLEKLETAYRIIDIELSTEADIPGIDEDTLRTFADRARRNCPVSQALTETNIRVQARLVVQPRSVERAAMLARHRNGEA